MNFFKFIIQDWKVNTGNAKGRTVLFFFRIANFCSTRRIYYYFGFIYLIFYRLIVEWVMGIEIPWDIKIGKNLHLFHGQALVINNKVVIGENCILRNSTTIGNKQLPDGGYSLCPEIGNHVDIGSNVCIIGHIKIEDHVLIGCGAVVVKDVSGDTIVTGNPGIARKRKEHNVATH
jgi:putative colanic acid biosynthesis acetyltransferase WcaB